MDALIRLAPVFGRLAMGTMTRSQPGPGSEPTSAADGAGGGQMSPAETAAPRAVLAAHDKGRRS